jgi:hypothetical protein
MAEKKWSALAKLAEAQGVQPMPMAEPADVEPAKAGRPRGKKSDPDFKPYTVLLRKKTHRAATDLLRDDEARDFSDLVQELVDQWIKGQGRG